MIFTYNNENYDLDKITRLYPAVTVSLPGDETTQVSLEWASEKSDKIDIKFYTLVFDFDPVGEPPINRKEIHLETEAELMQIMQDLGGLLNA